MGVLKSAWHKSSYSNDTGGACVEVAVRWHKSSYSGGNAGACVEVAETADAVLVRDTQHRHLGHLDFAPEAWAAFLANVKSGRL
ncbi:DUF397 domain-containing protein [Thermobifida alba]|jgi:hypothetical protein|uniref:DUF397 domain-containing protein n=1 Tax=Thermobifida alba TaxID=53522 RepID=A0ABY4L908_THEAE|nr:DUF397 domain-containing protein [Thermobifida alba]UPT22758.1 DUF397 domain-containing protein [Thermobifida alba]